MTADCIKAILDTHNEFRNIAAAGQAEAAISFLPKAARMLPIEWDTMLASLASLNCMNCVMDHDKCR